MQNRNFSCRHICKLIEVTYVSVALQIINIYKVQSPKIGWEVFSAKHLTKVNLNVKVYIIFMPLFRTHTNTLAHEYIIDEIVNTVAKTDLLKQVSSVRCLQFHMEQGYILESCLERKRLFEKTSSYCKANWVDYLTCQ